MASKPEPLPKDIGESVTPILLAWFYNIKLSPIQSTYNITDSDIKLAIDLIQARDSYGFNKYGQHLKTQDGRDSQEDAIQELGDLLQYVFKAKLNGEDIDKIKRLLPILIKLTFRFNFTFLIYYKQSTMKKTINNEKTFKSIVHEMSHL